ncbi:oxygenase MpaB family protein [Mycobacterium sp. SMC-4]|uniref:oxygenase MpaB family protein n=1 Tax=Mycobacterium sp. SMC-4 TaxID=2857059 RepID=UPI003CFCA6EC
MTAANISVPDASAGVPNAAAAIRRYGRRGRQWVDGVLATDPLADAVAAAFADLPPGAGMAMFRTALEQGIEAVADAPPAMKAFFAEVDNEPDWVNHDRLDRAAGHLLRHVSTYGIVLGAASLTAGAMNSAAGMPLVLTGRYIEQAAVRSLEVGSWLETILTPGGLRRDGAGFATTLRVRMIHAFVRRHLWESGTWDTRAWGAPIPQSFMAFTIVEFGHIALEAMRRLGVRYTAAELSDIYHFWRYVGLLNGVSPELNPVDEADQIRIEKLYALTAVDPDDGDRAFVRALTHDYLAVEIANLLPFAGGHAVGVAVINGLNRAFRGDDDATKLGVPDTVWKHLPSVIGPVIGGANRVLGVLPGVNEWRTRRAVAGYSRMIAEQRARYGMTHDLVDAAPDREGHPTAG